MTDWNSALKSRLLFFFPSVLLVGVLYPVRPHTPCSFLGASMIRSRYFSFSERLRKERAKTRKPMRTTPMMPAGSPVAYPRPVRGTLVASGGRGVGEGALVEGGGIGVAASCSDGGVAVGSDGGGGDVDSGEGGGGGGGGGDVGSGGAGVGSGVGRIIVGVGRWNGGAARNMVFPTGVSILIPTRSRTRMVATIVFFPMCDLHN